MKLKNQIINSPVPNITIPVVAWPLFESGITNSESLHL